jgi:UDPglucose 6-dehydrogenase
VKISIIGSGYVGLVTGACLAEFGNDVICLDIDQKRIDLLNKGHIPIYEPGLNELISRNLQARHIHFTSNIEEAVSHGLIQFIAVGTPSELDGKADLQNVFAAAKNIARYMTEYKVIVNKSTVPVGTAHQVSKLVSRGLNDRGVEVEFSVVSNP